ncbi:MAG: pyruvate kinase [archaeon GB-1867-035]|nr:pyruvate kinase [Candidatus Culexmicrobium profundum]
MQNVKIIATLGPASSSEYMINKLVHDVSGFRINFSHGSKEEWKKIVTHIKKACSKKEKYLALMGDLKGPSIRLGHIDPPFEVKVNDKITFKFGEKTTEGVPLPVKEFFEMTEEDDVILMDDGNLAFKVEKALRNQVIVRALTPGKITSRKAVVIRGKETPLPTITNEDLKAIDYAIKNDFDYIALSYVRNGNDVKMLREILEEKNASEIGIVVKIETISGVKNLNEIISQSDVVLIARGDLGMHFPLEEVPKLQSKIIEESMKMGKPVIVATQILASMMENPSPTRAEVSDVALAIREGVDAIMLTGETAIGKYPIESVKWLKRIIETYSEEIGQTQRKIVEDDIKLKFTYSVVVLAESLNAKLAVYTKMGRTALRISRFRPKVTFYAASNNPKVLRKLSIIYGTIPIKVKAESYVEGVEKTYHELIQKGKLVKNDIAVLTYGFIEEEEHTIKIKRVK